MSKLDILVAEKVMGYYSETFGTSVLGEAIQVPVWMFGEKCIPKSEFSPSTSLDDALVCLERAAQGKGYSIYMFPEEKKPYDVELEVYKVCTDAETLPLAMCICALRASGVPESLITQAMEEK